VAKVVQNKAVRNERRKLAATYYNGMAVAVAALGFFGPLINFVQTGSATALTAVVLVVCTLVSGALHWWALRVLGGMEE
jgi:hypothetical protein